MSIVLSAELEEVFGDLGRCLEALGEYRSRAVLAGGLASVLYRYYLGVDELERPPLTTFDMDWTLPVPLELLGDVLLRDRMQESGFELYSAGSGEQQAFFYKHRDRNPDGFSPIHVEFLAARPPAEARSDDPGAVRLEVQEGLEVQALRNIELLFEAPLVMTGAQVPALAVDPELEFRLAEPAAYVVQKVLARTSRRPEKQDKDLAYVYDVALLFRERWDELQAALERLAAADPGHSALVDRAGELLGRLFASAAADGPVAVVRVFGDAGYTAISEAGVSRVMQGFVRAVGLERGSG